jgi:hypothetical protein
MSVVITKKVQQDTLTFNDCLTLSIFAAILSALSPHVAVRVSSRENQEMPHKRVYLRLRYSMQEIIYGGRYLGSFGSHGSLAMSTNPHNVHRQKFSSFKRCPLTFKRDHTMSQNNSAPSAQAPIVLNPQTLAKVMQWLERAQNHAGNVAIKFSGHESALEFTEIECEIATAYDLLSHVIMSGVKAPPTPQLKTIPKPQATTSPKRQTTGPGHGLEVDGRGYDCRVLLNEDGDDYLEINPCCTPPAGYRQVCIKCGYDSFMLGVFYGDCPQCQLRVVHYCRYVAIAGGK